MKGKLGASCSEEVRSAFKDILLKHSPHELDEDQKLLWAEELEATLHDVHGGDAKLIKKHLLQLFTAYKQNSPYLSQFTVHELVSMSPSELGAGTSSVEARSRLVNGLVGWETYLQKAIPQLPAESEWFQSGSSCRLVIVSFQNKDVNDAFTEAFRGVDRVTVIDGNILHQDGGGYQADAFLSPANTIGNMDGGIDRIYADHFKWPYGRPYKDVNPLQEAIDMNFGQFKQLPIGEALLVPVSYKENHDLNLKYAQEAKIEVTPSVRYLIAAPTMVRPEEIEKGSFIVYQAALAAFRVWRESAASHNINTVATPTFGTGFGNVPPVIAARQMWAAFVDAWSVW